MFRSLPPVRLLCGLTLLIAFAEPGLAAGPRRMPAPTRPAVNSQLTLLALQQQLGLPANLLAGARLYLYPEILKQTLADHSPDAAEVHTYLRDPVTWQKNMKKIKAYELGLPEFRLVLANGTFIRGWSRPTLPAGWRYHRFTDIEKGHTMMTLFTPTYLYEVQTPKGVAVPGIFGLAQQAGTGRMAGRPRR
jgi:hypothetical protein